MVGGINVPMIILAIVGVVLLIAAWGRRGAQERG
jgi:hypothetical protein